MPETITAAHPIVYQLRVALRGISPLIWRRLLVRGDSTIAELHRTLQVAFGWSDEHLHRFVIHGREHGAESLVDRRHVHLAALGMRTGERFLYEYDFTDGWQHDMRVEQILPLEAGRIYPRCVGGRRRVPPEDCGGPLAFLELRERYSLVTIAERLSALAERRLVKGYDGFVDDHYDEVRELQRWLEIDRFDRPSVNRHLAELATGCAGRTA
ncbi:MAG: plasmid pRiA4b ORF-3 family protein [Chloroflexi bacterium]|nr:plasmid pRiA4b ORF-3 family protein [Chloroflexota bacterium]